ncbi:hypothetical protein [Afipia carboxidovorans]|uniref:hypothetical protein n=1 Tax=Afipia carboxidovorans TaxID=40137 RepID=UPI0030CFE65A
MSGLFGPVRLALAKIQNLDALPGSDCPDICHCSIERRRDAVSRTSGLGESAQLP